MVDAKELRSFTPGGMAIIIGASGGIGSALTKMIEGSGAFEIVRGLSRDSFPPIDLLSEESIAAAAKEVSAEDTPIRLIVDATGILSDNDLQPEKSLRDLDGAQMARVFAINSIGPALLMKHFLPLLPREGKSVFATLSAKVGSIGDNRLGGWHSYRASKAALNQLVRTASIELKRRKPSALCVALHPGTVDTRLSAPFSKSGLNVQTPAAAAIKLLATIDGLFPEQSGGFYAYDGTELPW